MSYVVVEGCPASGKTTTAKELSTRLNTDLLLEASDSHPLLHDFYLDPKSNALETELEFVVLHYHQIANAVRQGIFRRNVVSDYFYEKDLIFPEVTLPAGRDSRIFESLWKSLRPKLPTPDFVLFLDAPTDFLIRRIRARGRIYEKPISFEYLDRINRAYEKFMKNYRGAPVVRLDATKLERKINTDPYREVAFMVQKKILALRG